VTHTDKELLALSKGKIKAEGENSAESEGIGNRPHQRLPHSGDPTPDHQIPEPESRRPRPEPPPCQELREVLCGPAAARGGQSATQRRGATLPKALGDKLQPKLS